MQSTTIAIIGAGNMGKALLSGLITQRFPAHHLIAVDANFEKIKTLQNEFAIAIEKDTNRAVNKADVIILAVKPQSINEVLLEIAPMVREKKPLIISIAAGIRIDYLQARLSQEIPIVRAMPNTPALVGLGATALYASSSVNKVQCEIAESILSTVGIVIWLDQENQMNAVTALSGSGPAYFFLLIEALQAAGEKLGLSSAIAEQLTLQTALGAATMAFNTSESIQMLRQQVTSPGGTTEAAIKILEKELPDLFLKALQAAKDRSEELGSANI